MRLQDLRTALGKFLQRRKNAQRRDFSCSDCERMARCSLPPNENCINRLMQIERDGPRLKRWELPQLMA